MNETVSTESEAFHTEDMIINMGPQHPSTHGVLRFIVKTDGEVMREAIPDVGYLHRSIEKIGEKVTWHGYVPYTDRADYLAAMFANQAFCMAAEKLGKVEVTRRGEFCRVIACELNRMASHLLSVGTFGQDIGAITPFIHAIRERETINDLMEEICGARLTYNYIRIGGVGYDVMPETCDRITQFLDHFDPILDEFNRLISFNKIFVERLSNIAVISKEDAFQYNIVGPNLRACGVKWDIRRDIPYSVYPELDFEVPVGTGERGTLGDSPNVLSVGTFGQDIGAITPFIHAIRERETINDLMEEICGARLTYNYIRIGGVGYDVMPETCDRITQFLDHFDPILDEFNRLISFNKIFVERLSNIAVISKEDAFQYNIVGPNLRACGVKWDIRRDIPYSVYPELDFEVPVGTGERGTLGDSYDRYMVRIREMEESSKILRQCLKMLPDGPAISKVARKFKPPEGEAYVRIESSRGDMGFYVASDGSEYPYRVRIRTGSFAAMSMIDKLSRGIMVADLIALIASLDLVAPEIDR